MNSRQAILITGAGGFTGMHACRHFYEQGYEVCGLYRTSPAIQVPWHVEKADLADQSTLLELVKTFKPSYVLHLAGVNSVHTSWEDPIKCLNSNVIGTLNLLEALKKEASETKIVVTGSTLEFDLAKEAAPHPYSLSKTIQTIVAQSWFHFFQLHIMVAKPSNLIGPGPSEGVCTALAKKVVLMEFGKYEKVLKVGSLSSARDFLDVRDAVRAYDVIFKQGKAGAAYEVGSGQLRSIHDLVLELQNQADVSFIVKETDPLSSDAALCHDLSKIEKLGWRAEVSFKRSITDVLQTLREAAV